MIQLENNGIILSKDDDLPKLVGSKKIYLDFETSSGDPKLTSVNPWMNCKICGIAITVDDDPTAYYIPWPEKREYMWLHNVLAYCEEWINHNIKYDVHALNNSSGIDVLKFPLKLVDTLTLAKLIDSDRFSHSLKNLNKNWLRGNDYESELKPFLKSSKDFGDIPTNIIGRYAIEDVLVTRRLYRYLTERLPEQCKEVWEMEQNLTHLLVEVERNGLCVNPQDLMDELTQIEINLEILREELTKETGLDPFDPASNLQCANYLIASQRLAIYERTDKGKPSFSKSALAKYLADPSANRYVIRLMIMYRQFQLLKGLFVQKYLDLHVDGVLHASYNQCIRTGRMSCSEPNMQQLNKDAKKLIIPPPGKVFISADFSQIEFRTIVHYLRNEKIIHEFNTNPNADFHQIVADMCGIPRKPAKNINFGCGYGAGKGKILSMLQMEESLMDDYDDTLGMSYQTFVKKRAEDVYLRYHSMLPELRVVAKRAEVACRRRGYVFNLYGRRRHLPPRAAYRAFNTVNQASAADLMKERLLALHSALPSEVKIVANVHDEVLFTADEKVARDPEIKKLICDTMEKPSVDLRVPVKTSFGIGVNNWAEIVEI